MSGRRSREPRVAAILVAAGQGSRLGGQDKAFIPLGNHPLIYYPLHTLQASPLIHQIVLVLRREAVQEGRGLVAREGFTKAAQVVPGGERRQDSVRQGLERVGEADWVVVHDGARPFLTSALLEQGLAGAQETGAAVAAVPVTDTIKRVGEDLMVVDTPRRDRLWAAQTPQVFRRDILQRAYQNAGDEATDDASLVERLGLPVRLYMGSYDNIKVTGPQDLALARVLLDEKGPPPWR